jgi:hypothetical protein
LTAPDMNRLHHSVYRPEGIFSLESDCCLRFARFFDQIRAFRKGGSGVKMAPKTPTLDSTNLAALMKEIFSFIRLKRTW